MKLFAVFMSVFVLLSACSYTQKIRTGELAFERKQYAVATDLLTIEYDKAKDNTQKARLAYLLGESYSILGNHVAAGKWFNLSRANGYGESAIFKLAKALKYQQEYEKAIAVFQELEKNTSNPLLVSNEIFECEQALLWEGQKNQNPFRIESMHFNSAKLEYAAFPYSDHQILFSSDRSTLQDGDVYKWTGSAFSDLYMYNSITEEVEAIDLKINSPENEGAACFSKDRETLYFTRCTSREGDAFCKLYESHRKARNWSEPKNLDFIQESFNYGHPCLIDPGNILLFSADLSDSYGGTDLYYSINIDGKWNAPVNLGPRINTLGDEKFPSFVNDTLYFASDGHPGMGGLDVFMSLGSPAKGWDRPENLRAPINSGSDDFAFMIDPFFTPNDTIQFSGFLSSSRNPGNQDDVFRFYYRKLDQNTDSIPDPESKDSINLFLNLQVNQRYYPGGDPLTEKAFIDFLADASIYIIQAEDTVLTASSDNRGKFNTPLDIDTIYQIKVAKNGYLAATIPVKTYLGEVESGSKITLNAELILDRIYANKEVIIPNIFYDFDQWFIRDDAKPALDEIVVMLVDNPGIKIVLGSHTDCRGTDEYNEELSGKRADAVVSYLIEKGINPERLQSVGYGKTRLANDCICEACTESQHQENRRTTFAIVEN